MTEGLIIVATTVDQLSKDFTDYAAQVGKTFTDLQASIDQLKTELAAAGVTSSTLDALDGQIKTAAAAAVAADPGPVAAPPASPAAAPADPAPAAPAPAPAPTQTVYQFTGRGAVDLAIWPLASVQTPDGQPLYTFSGDTEIGQRSGEGVGGAWHVYTGPTQPVSAAPPAPGPIVGA